MAEKEGFEPSFFTLKPLIYKRFSNFIGNSLAIGSIKSCYFVTNDSIFPGNKKAPAGMETDGGERRSAPRGCKLLAYFKRGYPAHEFLVFFGNAGSCLTGLFDVAVVMSAREGVRGHD